MAYSKFGKIFSSLINEYFNFLIRLLFYFFTCILIAKIVFNFIPLVERYIKFKIFRNRKIKKLKELTTEEKEILRSYLEENTRCVHFDIRNGVVNELVRFGILYRSSNLSDPYTACDFAFNIDPFVFNFLKENRSLIEN